MTTPAAQAPIRSPTPLWSVRDSWRRLRAVIALKIQDLRRKLGIRRGVRSPDRVAFFKELSAISLPKALSARGPGFKDYRVTFSDHSKLVIRCTNARCFADLTLAEELGRIRPILEVIRPGMRVLELASPPATTGYVAAALSKAVGESGAVVSVTSDELGAKFAAKRYARANVSYEFQPSRLLSAVDGEFDGSFDAVVCACADQTGESEHSALAGILRLVAAGGVVFVGLGTGVEFPKSDAWQVIGIFAGRENRRGILAMRVK